jgi:hypothetical protein
MAIDFDQFELDPDYQNSYHAYILNIATKPAFSPDEEHDIHEWVANAMKRDSLVARVYKYHEGKWDLTADIARCLPVIARDDSAVPLRRIWHFLMSRADLGAALTAGSYLGKKEGVGQRVLRMLDLAAPRIFAAVLIGFILTGSNSILLAVYARLSCRPAAAYACAALCLVLVFGIALVKVQTGRKLLRRGVYLTAVGIFWGSIGGCIQFFLGPKLGFHPDWTYSLLCSAGSLAQGFVFQLFWDERPVTEPL